MFFVFLLFGFQCLSAKQCIFIDFKLFVRVKVWIKLYQLSATHLIFFFYFFSLFFGAMKEFFSAVSPLFIYQQLLWSCGKSWFIHSQLKHQRPFSHHFFRFYVRFNPQNASLFFYFLYFLNRKQKKYIYIMWCAFKQKKNDIQLLALLPANGKIAYEAEVSECTSPFTS